jgi:hypothetical protein
VVGFKMRRISCIIITVVNKHASYRQLATKKNTGAIKHELSIQIKLYSIYK